MTDEQLFHNAIALGREKQSTYLEKACSDDDQKLRVQTLLAAHCAKDSLLDTASTHERVKRDNN